MIVDAIRKYSNRSLLLAATVLCSLAGGFFEFGLLFALVVIPLVGAGYIVYRIYLEKLGEKTSEVGKASRLHLATIEALATAIDARDQIGSGHVRRTQIYSVGLGEVLGLSEMELNALRIGALLHDIGKLAVPDHILSKPGKLTSAELEKAKTHSAVGASILEAIDFPYPVVPTVRFHHEAWDGSGYPNGISGNDIPITARILAVANTYDALRSERPYRQALPREEARRLMSEGAGNQFDPHVVQVFLKNLSVLEKRVADAGLGYQADAGGSQKGMQDEAGYVEQIKLANREVFTLYELTREFSEADKLEDVLAMFARRVRSFVPFDTCSVFLFDETRMYAEAVHVEGKNKLVIGSKRIRPGEGATGFVLKRREAVINVNPDLDFSTSQLEMVQEYSTMVSIPLVSDNELIGAISIYSASIETYEEEHVRLLETIARIASGAIAKLIEHAEAKAHALTDPMTELPNARNLHLQFEKEISRALRGNTNFQMLMLDLDGFKAVNDNFGHKVGDRLLREIGKIIHAQLREYDFLARYGGDEFCALIPSAAGEDVADLCTRIEKAVTEFSLEVDGKGAASVGVSLGSASYPHQGETFDQLVAAADRAMYRRKLKRREDRASNASKTQPVPKPPAPSLESILSAEAERYLPAESASGLIVELDERAVVATNAVN